MATTQAVSRAVVALLAVALASVSAAGLSAPQSAKPRRAVAVRGADRLTSKVDPFIGTGGHGHTYPGATLPFGMVQLSPDTRLQGWDGCSGYHSSDTRVYGFSHTHLSGTGVPDYCDVLLAPTTGALRLHNGADGQPGYSSAFSHDDERASPGYYRVGLHDFDVVAELTATERVGVHRYTFPKGRAAHVVLDLTHRDRVLDSSLRFVGDREIEGMRQSSSWAQDQRLYFVARFSRPFANRGISVGDHTVPVLSRAGGTKLKAFVDFGDGGGVVVVKVAVSAVSVEGARRNLDVEAPGWDFDAFVRRADAAWERELSKIRVEGGSPEQQTVLYTALYHALLAPNVCSDVDGRYRGRDLKVHRGSGARYYTVFSLWDTFRALHPLLTITHRKRTSEFIQTFLAQVRDGGRLPVWELAGNETECMIGYHAVPVIVDAMRKGIGGFDQRRAFDAMLASADADRFGLASYRRLGFVAAEDEPESVSKTLEYAYDDWCIALAARQVGRMDEYARFLVRAQGYKHLFDPATGFARARVEGHWFAPFDPAEVNVNYTEANAWQYAFFAPQDIDGLMALYGGREAFAAKLDALFAADSALSGREQVDISGLIGQYAHGNEPSHHIAYLYAFAGQPWKTQALVHRIMREMYSARPDGLAGNEDCGQMSAWFVLSALGFYSVTPGSTQYTIGSPLFPKATISLENGRSFVIRAEGASPKNVYIQSARLDGKPYTHAFLEYATIARGGELVFEMGPEPNPEWGTGPGDLPRTAIEEHRIVPAPFVATGDAVFDDETQVELGVAAKGAQIHYTLDGSAASAASARYEGPIRVAATTTLSAVAVDASGATSPVLSAAFVKRRDRRSVVVDQAYAPQYSGGGPLALVDGVRGGPNYRLGRWQGYWGKDVEAVVDLGDLRDVHRVAVGFLQDSRSWILLPKRVEFAVSEDGREFRDVGVVESDVDASVLEVLTRDFAVSFDPVRVRYVRARIRCYGKLPSWHLGAGGDAWVFADEIVVE